TVNCEQGAYSAFLGRRPSTWSGGAARTRLTHGAALSWSKVAERDVPQPALGCTHFGRSRCTYQRRIVREHQTYQNRGLHQPVDIERIDCAKFTAADPRLQ